MLARVRQRLAVAARAAFRTLHHRLVVATKPATGPFVVGTLADVGRSKPALIAENALLRQQLIILQRRVKRPRCTPTERTALVLLASRVGNWRQALLIVQPETLLRWHRHLLRWYWRRRSGGAAPAHRPPLASETIALIRAMAAANRTWGAERIRGELLKLDIRVAKSTIQRYMRRARPPRCAGQTWATFLRNHGHDIWACDFLPVTDLLFRPLYAFFVVELASRRIMHVGVTRHPSDAWTAQQLREASAGGRRPKHLIHDFVELTLAQNGTTIDRNVYWLSTQPDVVNWKQTLGKPQGAESQYANLQALQRLQAGSVSATVSTATPGVTNVTITNTSTTKTVAFFLRADVRRGTSSGTELSGDNQLLPITWSDNDITLFPGESQTLTATYTSSLLQGATPVVSIQGWNIAKFDVVAG